MAFKDFWTTFWGTYVASFINIAMVLLFKFLVEIYVYEMVILL